MLFGGMSDVQNTVPFCGGLGIEVVVEGGRGAVFDAGMEDVV